MSTSNPVNLVSTSDTIPLTQIVLEKFVAEHPEALQEKPRAKIDLREFQTVLLKKQFAARSAPSRETIARERFQRSRRRNRVRQNILSECKVVDTRKDASGKHLYYELSNGQAVRADRFLEPKGKASKTRRKNRILSETCAAETIRNAQRTETAATAATA